MSEPEHVKSIVQRVIDNLQDDPTCPSKPFHIKMKPIVVWAPTEEDAWDVFMEMWDKGDLGPSGNFTIKEGECDE